MQSISPEVVFRGINAWQEALPKIANITTRPLVLGRSKNTNILRKKICEDLKQIELEVFSANLNFDCCQEDLARLKEILLRDN